MRDWGYRCELTMPQIEIMQSDLPHTLYLKDHSKKKEPAKNTVASDEVLRLQEEANRKMRERKARRKQEEEMTATVDELFSKSE